MFENTQITARKAPDPHKKRRKRRVNPKIVQAIEFLATGRARTKAEAASMASISPEWFGKMLKRPEIGVLYEQMTLQLFREGRIRATARMMDLMDSASSKVSFEASRFVLAVNKIAPPRADSTVNVNINSEGPGYVIRLATRDAEVLEGEVREGVGGVLYGRRMSDQERREGVVEQRHPMIDVTPNRGPADE